MPKYVDDLHYEDDWGLGRSGEEMLRIVGEPQQASVDGQGGTIRGKPVWDIDQIAFQLNRGDGLVTIGGVTYRTGAEWFGAQGPADNDYYFLAESKADNDGTLNTLNFGFYETLATLPEPYVYRNTAGNLVLGQAIAQGFSPFSADQRAAAREAISYWDDLITVKFNETPFQQGDINFMNTTTGPAQASAYLPYDYGVSTTLNFEGNGVSFAEISGDVYVAPPSVNPSNGLFDEGQYGLTTLIHEIGHSLGLEHPGAYNFGPGFAVTYENGAEYYQDSNQYSIMSYWDSEETGANHVDWELLTYRYPSTPLVHDIAAIQRIYGADMTTRTGDTVYGFNSTAGKDSYDFSLTPQPVLAIWDAGGNDTLDLSGFDTPSIINLNPGAFSSGGGFLSDTIPTLEEINARRAEAGLAARTQDAYDQYIDLFGDFYTNGLMSDNIGIAYGAVIENAVGGAGDDLIIANTVANRLSGGGGSDTASWEASDTGVTVNLANGRNSGGAAGDVLNAIENLKGSTKSDNLTGDGRDNVINGNGGGDVMNGGAGVDTLSYAGRTGAVTANLTTGANNQGDRFLAFENLIGGEGNDTLNGSAGANMVGGGDGDDRIDGASGDDVLNGDAGSDRLIGGSGADSMNGGAGGDMLDGGAGDDVIDGGAGSDTLTGGSGRDMFVFADEGGTDRVTDFRRGQDLLDFSDLSEGDFSFLGSNAFSATGAAEIRTGMNAGVFSAFVDANGDGAADLIVALPNVGALTQADLIP